MPAFGPKQTSLAAPHTSYTEKRTSRSDADFGDALQLASAGLIQSDGQSRKVWLLNPNYWPLPAKV